MKHQLWATLALAATLALPLSAGAVGAIAVDDEEGEREPGYGFVVGMDNEHEAKAGALRECRKAGNRNCQVAVWFKQCGAYASSRKHSGIGYGATKKQAEARALDDCGTDACRIQISECE
jgi:hypothetical protein